MTLPRWAPPPAPHGLGLHQRGASLRPPPAAPLPQRRCRRIARPARSACADEFLWTGRLAGDDGPASRHLAGARQSPRAARRLVEDQRRPEGGSSQYRRAVRAPWAAREVEATGERPEALSAAGARSAGTHHRRPGERLGAQGSPGSLIPGLPASVTRAPSRRTPAFGGPGPLLLGKRGQAQQRRADPERPGQGPGAGCPRGAKATRRSTSTARAMTSPRFRWNPTRWACQTFLCLDRGVLTAAMADPLAATCSLGAPT